MQLSFLTQAEIESLTGRKKYYAQEHALRGMGIECKRRPDGSIAVLRAHMEEQMGLVRRVAKADRPTQPNFAALN